MRLPDLPPLIFDPSGLPERIYLYPRPRRNNLKALGEGWETVNNGEGIAYIKEEASSKAEAEIIRLREALKEIREYRKTDKDLVKLIDRLLKTENVMELKS